jgi:drug/metabolite transporter (DMT)-like permease
VRGDWIGVFLVVCAVVVWSFSSVIIPLIHTNALTFVFFRSWLGAAMLACLLVARRYRPTRRSVLLSMVAGVLFSSYTLFIFDALKHTSVADMSAISSLQPALVLLIAGPLFGELVTRSEAAGTIIATCGIIVVVLGGGVPSAGTLRGDAMAVGALLVWTAYFLAAKRIRTEVDGLEFVAIVMLVSSLIVTPFALGFGHMTVPSAPDISWIALYAILATAGNLFVIWAHPRVDTTVSSLVLVTSPILAALSALVFLGQGLPAISVVGIFVSVLAMGYVLSRATSGSRRKPTAAPIRAAEPREQAAP